MNFVHELHQELTYSARRHVGDATVVRSDARAERRDGVVLIEPRRRTAAAAGAQGWRGRGGAGQLAGRGRWRRGRSGGKGRRRVGEAAPGTRRRDGGRSGRRGLARTRRRQRAMSGRPGRRATVGTAGDDPGGAGA